MSGSSIAAATDYLISLATSSSAAFTVNGQPVLVCDGYPTSKAQGMFVIGLDQPPEDANAATVGTRTWGPLGAKPVTEDYSIPCYINCWSGGTNQKSLRDTAVQIFDAFFFGLWSDLTLGGALEGGLNAEVVDLSLIPTASGAGATEGRRALITFAVHCRSRYVPS